MENISGTCDCRNKLEILTRKARALLAQKQEGYDRTDMALLDMIEKAEAVLSGKKFPLFIVQ